MIEHEPATVQRMTTKQPWTRSQISELHLQCSYLVRHVSEESTVTISVTRDEIPKDFPTWEKKGYNQITGQMEICFSAKDGLAWAVHNLTSSAGNKKSPCQLCNDGDGRCVFPYYGTAPHVHDTSRGLVGSTRLLPREQWGENFREDPESPGQGVYLRCPHCGCGEAKKLKNDSKE